MDLNHLPVSISDLLLQIVRVSPCYNKSQEIVTSMILYFLLPKVGSFSKDWSSNSSIKLWSIPIVKVNKTKSKHKYAVLVRSWVWKSRILVIFTFILILNIFRFPAYSVVIYWNTLYHHLTLRIWKFEKVPKFSV